MDDKLFRNYFVFEFVHPSGWRHCSSVQAVDLNDAKKFAFKILRVMREHGQAPETECKIKCSRSPLNDNEIMELSYLI